MSEKRLGRLTLVRDDTSGPVDDDAQPDPAVGEIWLARSDRGTETPVLVIEVHGGHVQALLCGEECEWATETDAVLDSATTGFARRLLIHGDVSGSILTHRLQRSIGQIEPDLVQRIALRGRGRDFTSSDLGRGSAILSDMDPRWDWKLGKHRQLRQIRARASELGWEIYRLGPREE